MTRVRYEVFLDGRLLRETEQVFVGTSVAPADPGDPAAYVDGQYRWMVDRQYIADDVAQAMLAQGSPTFPGAS